MADKGRDSEEDVLEMTGYRENMGLKIISWIVTVLTLGILQFAYYLWPIFYLKSTHTKSSLESANKLLVTDIYEKKKTYLICDIDNINLTAIRLRLMNSTNQTNRFEDDELESIYEGDNVLYYLDGTYQVLDNSLRIVTIKKLPYVWDKKQESFRRIAGIGPGLNHSQIHNYPQFSKHQRHVMRCAFGDNVIEVPDTPFILLVIKETFSSFYLLQFVNSILWGATGSYVYCGVMIVFTLLIILLTSLQSKVNQIRLKKSIIKESQNFQVLCGNEIHTMASDQLVPGDRVMLPNKSCKVPCDGIIIHGSCIVNESTLTGESIPQTKTPLPLIDAKFNEQDCSGHMLYTGTDLLKTHGTETLLMLVTRTGFSTAHGSTIRSILYPRPLDYDFENSVVKFALAVFSFSFIGAVINDVVQIINKEDVWVILFNTVKICIMLIPPIMPVLSSTKLYGIRKLINKKVYCINTAAFNLAGSTTCACFDKTGTLTEDGLDLYAVVPSISARFVEAIGGSDVSRPRDAEKCVKAMASCHSLVLLDQLTGDPIDVKMFEWTNWILRPEEVQGPQSHQTVSPKNAQGYFIKIVYQYQFSSKLQRMSVVVKDSTESHLRLYTKGSPEAIANLSLPHTVPPNFFNTLEHYTRRGFRVLALATRVLDVDSTEALVKLPRDQLETRLEFLGLIAFENKLKPQTVPTIEELKNANYKIVMITGDNQQTAECVAKECRMIEEDQTVLSFTVESTDLICNVTKSSNNKMAAQSVSAERGDASNDYVLSIDGKAWPIIKDKYRDVLPMILVKSAIFARMTSDQKGEVIHELNALGYRIVMCGDGANDCGALRAADVGISLSKNESSAAASFSSHVTDISCVPHVIRFGRCSVSTSVSFFKYMILASFITTIVERFMQGMGHDLSSGQLIYLSFISYTNFAIWFSRVDPHTGPLPPHVPLSTVISLPVIFSVASNLLVYFGFQVGNYFLVRLFSWYREPWGDMSYESYAMFCTEAFQLIILAVSQSSSYPFKKPIYTNFLLSLSLVTMTILGLLITLHAPQSIIKWLEIPTPPNINYPLTLLGLVVVNFLIIMFIEKIIVDKILYEKCQRYPFIIKTKPKHKYIDIENSLPNSYDWVLNSFKFNHRMYI